MLWEPYVFRGSGLTGRDELTTVTAAGCTVIAAVESPLRQCIKLLDDALTRPPTELESEVDDVERQLAQVRDRLIERVHAADAPPDARQALDRVNAALSLVVGVEYPTAGIPRKLLTQARNALQDLLRGQPA